MLIEYKIRFDDDGVTISQRIEPGGSEGNVRVTTGEDDSGVTAKELPVSFRMTAQAASDDSGQGGGVPGKSGGGGGDGGDAPPKSPFFFLSERAPPHDQARRGGGDFAQKGEGGGGRHEIGK